MSLFEFLMIMVSIIIGLGISELLTGIARFIRCRANARGYWVHWLLVAMIFLALLQQWWEFWGFRDVTEWDFFGALIMLGGPVGLFLIAHLLFPEPAEGADFEDYYYGEMRPVFWLAVGTIIVATGLRPILDGGELIKMDNASSLVGLVGFIVLAVSPNKTLHGTFIPLFLLILLADILRFAFAIG